MAAAAGKKSTTSLSFFLEAFGFGVEEELSITDTQTWAEGVCLANGAQNKRSMDEASFRCSDVEISERTCKSCNVRDS